MKSNMKNSMKKNSFKKTLISILLFVVLISSALLIYKSGKQFKTFQNVALEARTLFKEHSSGNGFKWASVDWFEDKKTLDLCEAIEKNDLDEMQRLIDLGADANAKGRDNMPLVLWAFPKGPKVLETLLENGADPNIVFESSYGASPELVVPGSSLLLFAVLTLWNDDRKFDDCVDLLLKYDANPNLGERSCLAASLLIYNNREPFYSLLNAGADVNPKDYWYGYPVVNAISHPKELQTLLERGANYDVDTPQGSELQRAIYNITIFDPENFNRRRDKEELLNCRKWLEEHGVPFDNFVPLVRPKDGPLAHVPLHGDQSDPRFQTVFEDQKPESAPQKK